jgi:hypothetical protein
MYRSWERGDIAGWLGSAAALIGLVIPATQEVDGEINAGLLRHAAKMSPSQVSYLTVPLVRHAAKMSPSQVSYLTVPLVRHAAKMSPSQVSYLTVPLVRHAAKMSPDQWCR